MKNVDKPATTMTKREYFCLMLGVDNTGDEDLDAIVRVGTAGNARVHMMASLSGGGHIAWKQSLRDLDAIIKDAEEDLSESFDKT
jgi:hypothetical protein